jgi:hypothetical protein
LQYFVNAGWERDWIKEAGDMIRGEFDHSYSSQPVVEVVPPPPVDQVSPINQTLYSHSIYCHFQPGNIFDNLPSLAAPVAAELRDELDRYLSTDPEHVEDVLMWWTERRAMYPRLSRMALDYLSIPGETFALY